MERIAVYGCLVAIVLALSGCSGFRSQWKEAVARPHPGDFTGAWQGRWVSRGSGHEGELRCIVEPDEERPGVYAFRYWARWGFLSGAFTAFYPVTQIGSGQWQFSGESDLGMLGGVYSHEGEATERRFEAEYRAAHGDHGIMEMRRPPKEATASWRN
jgi:hypothetical protein